MESLLRRTLVLVTVRELLLSSSNWYRYLLMININVYHSFVYLSVGGNFMTTLKLLIFIFCVALLSCKNDQQNPYSNLLLGDWTYIENDSLKDASPFNRNIIEGYSFLDKGICNKKIGYFKKIKTKIPGMENAIGDRTEQTTNCFLGTETKYKIEGDSLKIFNLTDSIWEGRKILRLSNDTLCLQLSNHAIVNFAKSKYQIDTTVLFDELVVSTSGCFGTCPINNTIINQSGEVIDYGENYNSQDGLYTFSLTKDQYNKVSLNFKKVDIKNLKDEYEAGWTDDEEITLTFLKEGKIIKNIRDYGKVGPAELYWAYTPVRNMYQLNKLDSLQVNKSPLSQPKDIMFPFQLTLGLSKSEAFYLWNLLRKAKEMKEPFTKKYEINFHGTAQIKKVKTDGRFYTFETLDGDEMAFDIGFNFFDRNELTNKFKSDENLKVYK
jgi:Domain of unknown function (DUF6438)